MCVRGEKGRPMRMKLQVLLAAGLFLSLLASTVSAQSADFEQLSKDGGILRWALQQGGILVAFLITMWFYRRDLTRWAEERKKDAEDRAEEASQRAEDRRKEAAERLAAKDLHIEVLVDLVKSTTHQITNLVQQSAQLTSAVQSLANERRHQRP